MTFPPALKSRVHNRGVTPDPFLEELITCIRPLHDDLFAANANFDIYSKVKPELGPWKNLLHRKAVMAEVLRVLGMFESSGDFTEGVDTSRLGGDSPENSEAGAWQVSYDARNLDASLRTFLKARGITDGVTFQRKMKFDHQLAVKFEIMLLRIDVKNPQRLHNGPLYKGGERSIIRKSLRGAEHSVYPWLSRAAVNEFEKRLA
jgi:hypothetical protein